MRLTEEQKELVANHVHLARMAVAKYLRQFPKYDHLRDDLESEAFLGLCYAAFKYTPGLGATFPTFAFRTLNWCLRGAIMPLSNPVACSIALIPTGEMPVHEESHTPDPSTRLDALDLCERVVSDLVDKHGERDTEIFLRTTFSDPAGIAKEFKRTRSRIAQIRIQTEKTFNEFASSIRNEAA